MNPTILVATTDCWVPTARLVIALAEAGFKVEVVCPANHPVSYTSVPHRIHQYEGTRALSSFSKAIAAANPELVIPGDELAVRHLHALLRREQRNKGTSGPLYRLIVSSLGPSEAFPALFARSEFMYLAAQEGVPCPPTRVVANRAGLHAAAADFGFPLVLKADGTSGGTGVKIAQTLAEAERFWIHLQSPPSVFRAAKRAFLDRDSTLLRPALLRHTHVVNAQMFARGHEATSALLCWRGEVRAALHFEVIQKANASGHATVLRAIENRDMAVAAERMARKLQLSGFHGLDFMLDRATGQANLIEINPRTTQVGHLTMGAGHDLPAALYAAVTNSPIRPMPNPIQNETIALFPQEWIRDAESRYLRSGYHDVPWHQPELLRRCVRSRRQQSRWYVSQEAHLKERPLAETAPVDSAIQG
jgi:hypothetical protein